MEGILSSAITTRAMTRKRGREREREREILSGLVLAERGV
jgi:hypothetical protein